MSNNANEPQLPKSKRALRRDKVVGEIGSDNRAKGQIRYVGKEMQHRENELDEWRPAVYHNDIRHELIEEASRLGEYDHPRSQGYHEDDVTSFHPDHKAWGSKRENWPDLLFRIHKIAEVNRGGVPVQEKAPTPDYQVRFWFRGGKVVLDGDNHPIKMFHELPTVISSQIEGWELEAMRRRDLRMNQKDFRARMPHRQGKKDEDLQTPQAIGMRMTRFRDRAGLKTWEPRAGSGRINAYLDQLVGPECLRENSIRSFGRLLTDSEIEEMTSLNKGKYPEKARPRAASTSSANVEKKRKRTEDPKSHKDGHEEMHQMQSTVFEESDRVPNTSGQVKRIRREGNFRPRKGYQEAINSNVYSKDFPGYQANSLPPGYELVDDLPMDTNWDGDNYYDDVADPQIRGTYDNQAVLGDTRYQEGAFERQAPDYDDSKQGQTLEELPETGRSLESILASPLLDIEEYFTKEWNTEQEQSHACEADRGNGSSSIDPNLLSVVVSQDSEQQRGPLVAEDGAATNESENISPTWTATEISIPNDNSRDFDVFEAQDSGQLGPLVPNNGASINGFEDVPSPGTATETSISEDGFSVFNGLSGESTSPSVPASSDEPRQTVTTSMNATSTQEFLSIPTSENWRNESLYGSTADEIDFERQIRLYLTAYVGNRT